MANTVEIRIGAVRKRGEGMHANRKPWTLWMVTSEDGSDYRTFDGALADRAFRNVGALAEIEWEFGGYGRELKSLRVMERSTSE